MQEPVLNPSAMPQAVEVIPYRHEAPLFWISVYLAITMWVLMIVGTMGLAIPIVLLIGLLGVFAQSLLIAWIKGNAVRVTPAQFSDLHALYQQSCARLGIAKQPELYLAQADGMLNAIAVRFMRRDYVVLLSSVVDALDTRPEAIKFYMGHELAHVKRKHLSRQWWLWPGLIMPLVSPAYSRACEYTCDRHGLACCNNLDDAKRALGVLVAGEARWKTLNLQAFEEQAQATGGFWMAVNELTADYPWLCKRMVVLENREAQFPRRSFFAWMIALVSPRMGYGGAVVGFLYWLMLGGLMLALVGTIALGLSLPNKADLLNKSGALSSLSKHHAATAEADSEASEDAQTTTDAASAPVHTVDEVLPSQHARMEAIAQAIDRYQSTHKGKAPADLEALGLKASAVEDIVYEATPGQPGKQSISLFTNLLCKECGDTTMLTMDKEGQAAWTCLAFDVSEKTLSTHGIACESVMIGAKPRTD